MSGEVTGEFIYFKKGSILPSERESRERTEWKRVRKFGTTQNTAIMITLYSLDEEHHFAISA